MKFWSMKPKPTLLSKNIIFIKLKITPSPIYFDFRKWMLFTRGPNTSNLFFHHEDLGVKYSQNWL